MTRGPKPAGAIRDAKKFAEVMGYRWQENTDNPELGYDLQLFKDGYAFLLHVRVLRNAINPDIFYEDLLAEELREIRGLPFPKWMPREIWLRTRHERTFRRLRILDVAVAGIGFWEPDGYVNPYATDLAPYPCETGGVRRRADTIGNVSPTRSYLRRRVPGLERAEKFGTGSRCPRQWKISQITRFSGNGAFCSPCDPAK